MKSNKKIYFNFQTLKTIVFILIDVLIVFSTYVAGYLIEYHTIEQTAVLFMVLVCIFHVGIFLLFGGYSILTNNLNVTDAIKLTILTCLINVCACLTNRFVEAIPTIHIVQFAFFACAQSLLIVISRNLQNVVKFYSSRQGIPTMIIGAGDSGKIAYDEVHNNPELECHLVCFWDKDSTKEGKTYLGLPVYGEKNGIHKTITQLGIKRVIIAISNISKADLSEIIKTLKKENVAIKRLPILSEINENSPDFKIKDVSIDELLGRDQIVFDTIEIKTWLKDKTVLITGGGGSIGSELARQCFKFGAQRLILFDIYENTTYEVEQDLKREIRETKSNMELITLIGSTYNLFRVEEIFSKYRPDIVFHAAAYKHVPLMEDSSVEAIRTNCLGTYNVAQMADKYHTSKMVLVSTDKAVRPTNVMGATKAFAEMVIRYFSSISKNTSYSAVRFGNVLGSHGSVIPLFKSQIEHGGPVTVTHPDIIRYFMTIPEAVSLILQSGVYATGGEIFILDMGRPVKIVTLAENLIKQCGLIPYQDIDIEFVGLRPGEKLFEELLLNPEKNIKTNNEKIFIEESKKVFPMDENIKFISQVFEMTDNEEIKNMLRHVVTTYVDYEEFNSKNVLGE